MPLRNPFTKRPDPIAQDENLPPSPPGFERVDTVGSKASSALSIRSSRSQDTGEYKLSVVNDSGVFLPPSPPPTDSSRGTWPRRYAAMRDSMDKSDGDIEHFSISRESFDSYRRSFDISAKAPVLAHEFSARESLDSHRLPRFRRSPIGDRSLSRESTEEEDFEDVGLDGQDDLDDQKPQPRRHGFFSKFLDSQDKESAPSQSAVSRYLIGRKRGQQVQTELESELATVEKSPTMPMLIVEGQAVQ